MSEAPERERGTGERARRAHGARRFYADGDIGCVGNPVGYRSRGGESLDFIVDCGHLALDAKDDHAAILSSDMIGFLSQLR